MSGETKKYPEDIVVVVYGIVAMMAFFIPYLTGYIYHSLMGFDYGNGAAFRHWIIGVFVLFLFGMPIALLYYWYSNGGLDQK